MASVELTRIYFFKLLQKSPSTPLSSFFPPVAKFPPEITGEANTKKGERLEGFKEQEKTGSSLKFLRVSRLVLFPHPSLQFKNSPHSHRPWLDIPKTWLSWHQILHLIFYVTLGRIPLPSEYKIKKGNECSECPT